MKQLFLFICGIFLSFNILALEPTAVIKEANALYAKNNFEQALTKYLSVMDAGYESAELYFNIGNSYFKTHSIKSAILFYERAKLLNPGDKDIAYNLDMARTFTIDKIEAMPELFFVTWSNWLRNQISANGWAAISTLSFIIALLLLLLFLLSGKIALKKLGFWFGIVILFISLTAFNMGYQLKRNQTAQNTAIIFTPTITVKSSPDLSGNNLFVLHEGTKVEIVDKVGDWREIRIADGNRGWVKLTDIEPI